MSGIISNVSNVYNLASQIDALKAGKSGLTSDPESLQLTLQQNFSKMLSDLMAPADDDDDDNDEKSDPLAAISASYLQSASYLTNQQTAGQTSLSNLDYLFQNSGQVDPDYLYSFLNNSQTF